MEIHVFRAIEDDQDPKGIRKSYCVDRKVHLKRYRRQVSEAYQPLEVRLRFEASACDGSCVPTGRLSAEALELVERFTETNGKVSSCEYTRYRRGFM